MYELVRYCNRDFASEADERKPIVLSDARLRLWEGWVPNAIHILNGPNLNLLGEREPHIYGRDTLADVEKACRAVAERYGLDLVFRQTNAEHQMIDWLHQTRKGGAVGVAINPAAFCYRSVPVLDALKMCDCPVIEVHISNIHNREAEWRSHTITAVAATGMISGLGTLGYSLAVDWLAQKFIASRAKD